MNSVIHKADSRGFADHGWLKSHHSFSFANYYNPERMGFGVLRVLNDDQVDGGFGFGTHPHNNMEIISIPLEGGLKHKDSIGNEAIIQSGDVQVMSAGTGVSHSEFNQNSNRQVKFLQIWVIPNKQNVAPRYDQITLEESKLNNNLHQIVSPYPEEEGVWIHQNAWFSMGRLDEGFSTKYNLRDSKNGVYIFVLEGVINVQDHQLSKRDAIGLWETDNIPIQADQSSKLLVMEVPMQI